MNISEISLHSRIPGTPIKAQSKESHQPPVYLETGGRFNLRSQAAQFNAKVGGLHLMNPAFKTQDESLRGESSVSITGLHFSTFHQLTEQCVCSTVTASL